MSEKPEVEINAENLNDERVTVTEFQHVSIAYSGFDVAIPRAIMRKIARNGERASPGAFTAGDPGEYNVPYTLSRDDMVIRGKFTLVIEESPERIMLH